VHTQTGSYHYAFISLLSNIEYAVSYDMTVFGKYEGVSKSFRTGRLGEN